MPGAVATEPIVTIEVGGPNGPANTPPRRGGGDSGGGAHEVPQRTYVTGMTIALAGILMFFMALASALIVRKGMANDWQNLTAPKILYLNTLILLISSFTLLRSRRNLAHGNLDSFRYWWNITTLLGVFFLAGQLIAWRQLARAGVYLGTSPNSSFFYVFTAAHGIHLLGGVLALIGVALRPTQKLTRSTVTEVISMYWHFM
ncbi:MAG: cytochrome c oxidase subunit 3, partial [Candidatus Acidiferrales bacterium]